MTVYDLYYVTGRDLLPAGHDFITNLDEACRGGATIVQLREKQTKSGEFLELAQKAKAVCDKARYRFACITTKADGIAAHN